MAGEVIRDVIVKVKVQMGDDPAAPMREAEDAARKVVNTTEDVGEAARKSGEKQETAWEGVEKSVKDVRGEAEKTSREYREGVRRVGRQVDKLMAKEEKLAMAIRGRGRAAAGANAAGADATGVPGGNAGGGFIQGALVGRMGAAKGFFGARMASLDLAGARLGAGAGRLGTAAIPVIIIGMADEAASTLASAYLGTKDDLVDLFSDAKGLFGGKDIDTPEGFLSTDAMRKASAELSNAVLEINDLMTGRLFNLDELIEAPSERPDSRFLTQQEANTLNAKRLHLLQDQLATTEALHAQERTALQKELDAINQRVGLAKQALHAEQALFETAKQQFGMLDAMGRADFKRIAEKVDENGIGSLSKRELSFVRDNAAFAPLLEDEAKRMAEVSGFKQIAQDLGLSQDIANAKNELKLAIEQKADIKLELEGLNELPNKLRHELEDVLMQFLESEQARIKIELDRTIRQLANGGL